MLGQHAGRQAQRFLRRDGGIGPDLNGQFIIVGDLADTGVFHRVVDLQHRGVNAVDGQGGNVVLFDDRLFVALGRNITAALVERKLHHEFGALAQRGDVPVGVQDLEVIACLDAAGGDFAGAGCLNADSAGAVAVDLGGNALQVQNDLGDIFLDALDGRELMDHTVDLDTGDCDTGQRGQQHTTQAVAQRGAEAALQRFHNELAVTAVRGKVDHLDLGAFNLHHKNPP